MGRSSRLRGRLLSGRFLVCVAVAAILLASCGGAPPEILFADAQLFLVQNLENGTVGESLRLFIAVRDSDGIEDLSVVSIVHDRSDLYWQVTAEEWVTAEQDGDSWIGLPDIRPITGREFPRGSYRLLLEDESLQRVEGSFSITAPPLDQDEVTFPFIVGNGEAPELVAPQTVIFRVYNRTDQLVLSREVSPGVLGESLLEELPDESGLQAYLSSLPGEGIRLYSGPFQVPR